jgi:ABC-type sugar transport system ATPase subunit
MESVMPDSLPVVEMRNIQKQFGAVQALDGVDLTLYTHEILGLVGDNAAGKSTLMKILTGAYRPDAGDIFINGQRVHFVGTEASRQLGIEMVYQDFALVDSLDVTSNIFLGREKIRFNLGPIEVMDNSSMDEASGQLLKWLDIEISSLRTKVENLSGGERQAVAIVRATAFNPKIIIMDEPTAAMSIATIEKVIELIKRLKTSGASIIIISHRLEDIHRVGDRIIVLRQGRKVADMPIDPDLHTFREQVVAYMVGARDDFAGVR